MARTLVHGSGADGRRRGGRRRRDDVDRRRRAREAGDELLWIYDFGDNWEHVIRVETVADDPTDRIVCVDGLNAAPPEDCGGAAGYANLLEALADPSHEEHDDRLDWLGAPFDQYEFDRDGLNRRLKRLIVRGVNPTVP